MNKVILIASKARYVNSYNYNELTKYSVDQRILLYSEEELSAINNDAVAYFDMIIQLPSYSAVGEPNVHFKENDVYSAIEKLVEAGDDIKIICIDEGNIIVADKMRQLLSAGKSCIEETTLLSNKNECYSMLRQQNVSVPMSKHMNEMRYCADRNKVYDEIVHMFGSPFILKPSSASGSFGVKAISSYEEFEIIDDHELSDCIVNEHICGELYHCDIQLYKGRIVFSGVGRYLCPLNQFMEGDNIGSIILPPDDEAHEKILDFSLYITQNILNITHGSIHIEIFEKKDKSLTFLEAAKRTPGGTLIELYQLSYGVNLNNIDYFIQLGVDKCRQKWSGSSMIVASPTRDGVLLEIHPSSIKSTHKFLSNYDIGCHMTKAVSIADKATLLIAFNREYSLLSAEYEALRHWSFYTVR